MTREELKEQIDKLMQQYADEEIDGATYAQKMIELTTSARSDCRRCVFLYVTCSADSTTNYESYDFT